MKTAELGKTEQGYRLFLYLLILHFLNGVFFDFSATIYPFYLMQTPLNYPGLATASISIWLFITSLIFLKMLQIFGYRKLNPWILAVFFIFIYSAGIHVVGNSVQIKLWQIGYNDNLGHGLPYAKSLAAIPSAIMPIFELLYFYDEYLGHFLYFAGYYLFFLIFYFSGFSTKKKVIFKKYSWLFYSSAILNGLYIAWQIIEGQSILVFSVFSGLMIGIYLYQLRLAYYVDIFGKQLQAIFLASWIYIFLWFALIGHFNSLPQFFETIIALYGIKV